MHIDSSYHIVFLFALYFSKNQKFSLLDFHIFCNYNIICYFPQNQYLIYYQKGKIMAGSSFGNIFRITTWGESHGAAIGVVVDGCPAGLELDEQDIQKFLDRRKPGSSRFTTQRKEADCVEILSGVFEGKTTGTPISMLVRNTSQRSSDYSDIASYYRPGHADYTFDQKYGFRDYRGGGSSGRETIGRVAAGAVASKLLSELGITVTAYTQAIGDIEISMQHFDLEEARANPTGMPDKEASARAESYLKKCMENLDSAGGVIACKVTNLPAGIGEPVFEKLDANLAKAIMSIGAVKAFEIGDGAKAALANGSSNNDSFRMEGTRVIKTTNHAGGILGGISDGSEIMLKAYFKPTPSIFQEQETVSKDGENISVQIKGRHDPIIVPRAVVVVESMTAVTILDMLLQNMCTRMDHIKKVYL